MKWTIYILTQEALKYKTKQELRRHNAAAYSAAKKRGILGDICQIQRIQWTNEMVAEEAKKYKTRTEFQKKKKGAYLAAFRRGILDQVCYHMTTNKHAKWTIEELQQEALKYITKQEFRENSNAYASAHRMGCLSQICGHMKKNRNEPWTKSELQYEAYKYKTRREFAVASNSAYQVSARNDVLDDICGHMSKISSNSIPQTEVYEFVRSLYPDCAENTKKEIYPLELDIFVPQLKIAIEYCGLFWHSEMGLKRGRPNITLADIKNYHINKLLMCNEKGIRLITIFEDEWRDRQDQVKNFLLSVINKNEVKIGARKTIIKETPKKEAQAFLEAHHVQGSAPLSIAFGLYYQNELVGLITGNQHHREVHGHSLVLNRLVFKKSTTVSGGASKLLQALIAYARNNNYSKIISWSDNRWSEGNVYKQMNFILEEELPPDYSYIKRTKRISKQSCQKKNLRKQGAVGETESEMAKNLRLLRIWDCGKKRWGFNL